MKMQRKLQADGAGNNAPDKDFREILEHIEKNAEMLYNEKLKEAKEMAGFDEIYRPHLDNNSECGCHKNEYCRKEVEPTKISCELQYKLNEHGKLCDYLKNLYATKNADYGDSMHPLFQEYGLTAFLVLFGIKIQRIKSLSSGNVSHYESLEDSLLDLANYALIAVAELKAQKNKQVEGDK